MATLACSILATPPAFSDGVTSLDERVACEATLADLTWSEMLWPEANPGPKPARSEVISDAELRARVLDEWRMEAVLAEDYGIRIDARMLQRELDRIAASTRAPERLAQRFAALGHDASRIGECLVRPQLARSRLRTAYGFDTRQHGSLREQAEGMVAAKARGAIVDLGTANEVRYRLLRDDGRAASVDKLGGSESDADEIALDSESFDSELARLLAAQIERSGATGAPPVRETEWAFVHERVVSRSAKQVDVVAMTWDKLPFERWWAERSRSVDKSTFASIRVNDLRLPKISGQFIDVGRAAADSWREGGTFFAETPSYRLEHSAVWTGTEMIIWGGLTFQSFPTPTRTSTGARYDPVTDRWTATSLVNSPQERDSHVAVWTGEEMIIFGGWNTNSSSTSTGGRYNPQTDSWSTEFAAANAPSGGKCTAVWSGTEMIIWGGLSLQNSGARYDPDVDAWSAMSTVDAPAGRNNHSAVWTGDRMIVWGGLNNSGILDDGASYDPSSDTWTSLGALSAPAARSDHTAVWTGDVMLVWGGAVQSGATATGAAYDPETDTWNTLATAGAPDARLLHTAVWTGTEMVVWGGTTSSFQDLGTGGRYDPIDDAWRPVSTTIAPNARRDHTAVWTGSEMIIWGGQGTTTFHARYDPANDTWTPITMTPASRSRYDALWTGTDMIIWGGMVQPPGLFAGRYDPVLDRWTEVSSIGSPFSAADAAAVWTGSELIVWGGGNNFGNVTFDRGGRYAPLTDSWRPTSLVNAPGKRARHSGIWTGSEMLIWGGVDNGTHFGDGGKYDPVGDTWTAMSITAAPSPRGAHTASWSGDQMIVWGGRDANGILDDGARYDPISDSWLAPLPALDAPSARTGHTAVWTGNEMIVWGGIDGSSMLATGARYDLAQDAWTPLPIFDAPTPRDRHTAVWTGTDMIVWGGNSTAPTNTGARYHPILDEWNPISVLGAPSARFDHSAVWTGTRMIIWGGSTGSDVLGNGGVYFPRAACDLFCDGFEAD